MALIYQISLNGSAYDARNKEWDLMFRETGCKPLEGWKDPTLNRPLLKGEFGCSVSHLRVWEKIAKSNLNGIILEEDVVFDEINPDQVEYLLDTHDSVWLGYRLNSLGYWYNAHAYAITPDTASILIEGYHDSIIPVDEWMPLKLKNSSNYFYPKEVVRQIPRSTRPSTIEDTDMLPDKDINMHIVTVATEEHKMWALQKSAELYGVKVLNVGKHLDWQDSMDGLGGMPKIAAMKKWLKSVPKDDVVLFLDAYDTFFADDPATVLDRFLGFNVDILFGAEESFWPPDPYIKQKFDVNSNHYKYLNSGLYIGKAGALFAFFDQGIPEEVDDQRFCQMGYLKNYESAFDIDWKRDNQRERFPYSVALDHESYVFQNHDMSVTRLNNQLYNAKTNCCPCIYHGNGGEQAKDKFRMMLGLFDIKKEVSSPFILTLDYEEVAQGVLVTQLLTKEQCEHYIEKSDSLGLWNNLDGDKFPAKEIRLKKLGLWKECQKLWKDKLAKISETHWTPLEYIGLRDAFTMRYSMDTQTSLGFHTDASLITGSVKLNDNYEGATLFFPHQDFTNADVPVGSCILFPSQVTHGHYVDELKSGVKYSLTMWTSRFVGDENE